jgi:hypothetical protein
MLFFSLCCVFQFCSQSIPTYNLQQKSQAIFLGEGEQFFDEHKQLHEIVCISDWPDSNRRTIASRLVNDAPVYNIAYYFIEQDDSSITKSKAIGAAEILKMRSSELRTRELNINCSKPFTIQGKPYILAGVKQRTQKTKTSQNQQFIDEINLLAAYQRGSLFWRDIAWQTASTKMSAGTPPVFERYKREYFWWRILGTAMSVPTILATGYLLYKKFKPNITQ